MAELQAQIENLQTQLRKVNRESAERRRQIKELQQQQQRPEDSQSDTSNLQAELDAARAELATLRPIVVRYQLRDAFISAARESSITWLTDQAQDDAFALAQNGLLEEAFGEDGNIDMTAVKAVMREVLKTRTYLYKSTKQSNQVPVTDADKRNDQTPAVTAEQVVAQKRAVVGSPI